MLTILDIATGQSWCEPAPQPEASPEAARPAPPTAARLGLRLQHLESRHPGETAARQAPPVWDDDAYTAAQPDRMHRHIVRQ